ncbi:MAG: DUF4192 family protein [Microbacterium sp.]
MTTIVKAANAAEFVSLVPHLLGFHPTRSLVVVPFAGTRSLGAMRFDLPEDDVDACAATIIGMVCRVREADAAALVTYTDDRFEESGGMPCLSLVDALRTHADACGLRITDALCVAADGWGSFLDPGVPPQGHALADLDHGPDGLDVPVAAGDQAAGAVLPHADPGEREDVARALESLAAAVEVLCGPDASAARGTRIGGDAAETERRADARIDPRSLAAACVLDDLPALFESALGWDAASLSPFDAATLVWCLSRPALRDIALTQWGGGLSAGDEALDAQLRWEAGEEYPVHLAMRLWGEGDRPDPARLAAGLELARRVAAVAPRAAQPGPLATAAWISWALGRSTHAERYAHAAREIEPEHGLSEIVLSFVAASHLPDWAFRRS